MGETLLQLINDFYAVEFKSVEHNLTRIEAISKDKKFYATSTISNEMFSDGNFVFKYLRRSLNERIKIARSNHKKQQK